MTIFDHWKNLTSNKEELNDEASYQPYMITRFASMVSAFKDIVVEVNKYDLPKAVHYEFFRCALPKRYIKFDYIKKKTEDQDNSLVAKYFEFGSRDLKIAEKIMTPEEIEKVKRKFGGK